MICEGIHTRCHTCRTTVCLEQDPAALCDTCSAVTCEGCITHDCPEQPCDRCVIVPTPNGTCICRNTQETTP